MVKKSKNENNPFTLFLGIVILVILYIISIYRILESGDNLEEIRGISTSIGLWLPDNSSNFSTLTIYTIQITVILMALELVIIWFVSAIVFLFTRLLEIKIEFLQIYTLFLWIEVFFVGIGVLLNGSIFVISTIIFIVMLYVLGLIRFDKKLI